MDFFIQDLHQQIKQIHSNEQHRTKTTVYRSEGILYRVIERIKNNRGGLASFNKLLSTSDDSEISFAFASSCQSNQKRIGIFFSNGN